ncbi:MAG: hypothetical protein ACRD26_02105 [Vicinamibacterales bacterium]
MMTAASCGPRAADSIDAAAEEYVALARGVERRDQRLTGRIAAAHDRVSRLEARDGRRAFLLAQLRALERRARFLSGARTSIREEAGALGLSPPPYDGSRAAALRAELDAVLPGQGLLVDRLAQHRQASALPRARLDAVSNRLVDECRARTPVPDDLLDAGVELRYVIDRPWPAFTSYRDDGRSTVEIRRDAAWFEADLRRVLCHETYPGHHLQNLVWDDLRDRRGWVELAVTPAFTPHGAMAERLAVAATDLAVPRAERPAVSRILDDLAPLALALAIATADGEIARDAGLRRLRDEVLMPDAGGFLAFVEENRSMAVAYVTPVPGVRDWQTYLALLRSPERLVGGAVR